MNRGRVREGVLTCSAVENAVVGITRGRLRDMGRPMIIVVTWNGRQSAVEKNARELKDHIVELYWGTGKRVVLLGHSKGGVDAAAACSMFWPDLKDKVVGIVLVQSPYGGSPIASDILREGQIADFETRRVMEILICKIIKVGLSVILLLACSCFSYEL